SQCTLDAAGDCSGDAFAARLTFSANGAPALASSTFLGGSASDAATAIAVDASGNVLLAGVTASADFPLASALQSQSGGQRDAFLAKLRSDGSALLSSTYLGGSADDAARAIATDSRGNIFLAGDSASADFPLADATQPQCAFDPAGACSGDAFLAALNPAASQLHFATYLGGSGADSARALALDANGAVYLAGASASADLPAAQPVQPVHGGDADAFLAQFTDVVPASRAAAPDQAAPAITACTGTVQWIGPANGQWNTAANWSTGVIPISTDDVCIPPGANGPVVVGGLAAANQSINSLITNVELLFNSGPLTIANPSTFDANYTMSGGSLTLNSMATFTGTVALSSGTLTLNGATGFNGAFNLSGGSLTGTGTLTISGLFTWSAGIQDGGGITDANGGMLLNGGIRTLRTRTLNTPTAVTWTAGRFDHGLSAVINNTSTWDLQSDDDFLFTQGGTRGVFNNTGTLTKSAGATLSNVDLTFNNLATGTVNVNVATLGFTVASANSGVINVAAGALLDFST
ncbi:MAG TPA: SBBP repeat-containing protein, partial [Dongiaceae bacterium]